MTHLQPFATRCQSGALGPISWTSIAQGTIACIPLFWIVHRLLLQWLLLEPSGLGSLSERWLVPLHATWQPRFSLWVVPALLANAVFFTGIVPLLLNASRRLVLVLGVISFIGLSVATSMMDGYKSRGKEVHASVVMPFSRTRLQYYGDVPLVEQSGGPRGFIRQFSEERLHAQLSFHSRSHPPGAALFLWAVNRWLAPGLWPASLAAIVFSSLASLFIFLIAHEVYGQRAARAALALFLVTPSVVLYAATSMDSVFAVPAMAALFLFLRSQRPEEPWTRVILWGGLSGLALAIASFFTYAVVCLPVFFVVLMLKSARDWTRAARMLLSHAAGLTAFAAFYGALFLWADYRPVAAVLASITSASRWQEQAYMARYVIVSLSSLVAFATAIGFPTLTLWVLKATRGDGHWRRDALANSFALSLLLIGFSTLFRLEVERIWLFMSPLVLAPAGRWLTDGSVHNGDIALQRFIAALAANTFLAECLLDTP